jgi:transcriptional regulator with XRE-family HTH domain
MSDQQSPTRNETLAGLPIHERIRELREERQLPAYRLAEMAKISPSYLSLIESGEKVPSEEVAVAIATALGDDPDLYRGWSHAGGREGLVQLLDSLRSYVHYTSGPEWEKAVALASQAVDPGSMDSIDIERLLREARGTQALREVGDDATASIDPCAFEFDDLPTPLVVPLLEEGVDPADDPTPVETLRFDRRLLPEGDTERLFAYRPGPDALSRAGDLIKPGELVVLSSRPGNLDPQSVHAVRFEGRIVLSRVLFKGNALLLLPPEGSSEFDIIEIDGRSDLDHKIAGTVVLTVRDWGAKEETTPPLFDLLGVRERGGVKEPPEAYHHSLAKVEDAWGAPQTVDRRLAMNTTIPETTSPAPSWSLRRLFGTAGRKRSRTPRPYGRSYTLEDDTLVRRVEWKDGYGWRPTQRPEDLRWLEAEPGRRIRFELTRGDEVRYHLEMDPDEWRDALGDYGESPSWPRHGYITSITRMRDGEYTEEFKDRWAAHVKKA